jgi:hypothetical protein
MRLDHIVECGRRVEEAQRFVRKIAGRTEERK